MKCMSFSRRLATIFLMAAPACSFASGYADLPDPALVLAELKAARPAAFASVGQPLLLAAPADRADVDALWARIQDSALGRELSIGFVARGRRVRVVFEEMGTKARGEDLDGPRGWSDFESDTFVVHVSALLRAPRWRDEGAGTFAHELLGHCDRYQAVPPDLSTATYHLYAGDETYASLVGYAVSLELGSHGSAEPALALAEGRAAVESKRRFVNLAYAQALSLSELFSADQAYASRRDDAARARVESAGIIALNELMAAAADHFITVHGEHPGRYAALRASLESKRAILLDAKTRHEDAESYLTGLADRYAAGTPETAGLRAAASNPFLADVETRIAALSSRVRVLAARAAPPSGPAIAGASTDAAADVDQDELLSKLKSDVSVHPEFWKAATSHLPR
jgi:hypothetical protein